MRQLPNDPYQWWVGKRVDVRTESKLWVLGEVVEAARGSLVDTSTGVVELVPYEADPGDPDGQMSVIFLDGSRPGDQAEFDIYPGEPIGMVPNVTPHIEHSADIASWWGELSAQPQAALLVDPDGPVPPLALEEVVKSGASVVGAYWPDVQSGPDGFRLPSAYQRFIEDHTLLRDYERAEDALAAARRRVGTSTLMSDPDVHRCAEERARTKRRLDDFRLAEIP